jgi:arylsulfatase A-like enzyme
MAARPHLNLTPVTASSVAPEPAVAPPAKPARARKRRDEAPARAPRTPTAPPAPEVWREWGPFHHTVSFKWPSELVAELDDRRHDLREPIGLMVIAAVAHLLDQDDQTIRGLLDRAEQAKPRARRGRSS